MRLWSARARLTTGAWRTTGTLRSSTSRTSAAAVAMAAVMAAVMAEVAVLAVVAKWGPCTRAADGTGFHTPRMIAPARWQQVRPR